MPFAWKLLGAVCVVAGSAAGGCMLSRKLGDRTASLRMLRAFFLRMQTQLQYTAMSFEQAVAEQTVASAAYAWLQNCLFRMRQGVSFGEAFGYAVQRHAKTLALRPSDVALLCRCSERLGSTDLSGQIALLALIDEELRGQLEKAASDEQKRGKLCRSLGLLCGALVVVVML